MEDTPQNTGVKRKEQSIHHKPCDRRLASRNNGVCFAVNKPGKGIVVQREFFRYNSWKILHSRRRHGAVGDQRLPVIDGDRLICAGDTGKYSLLDNNDLLTRINVAKSV